MTAGSCPPFSFQRSDAAIAVEHRASVSTLDQDFSRIARSGHRTPCVKVNSFSKRCLVYLRRDRALPRWRSSLRAPPSFGTESGLTSTASPLPACHNPVQLGSRKLNLRRTAICGN